MEPRLRHAGEISGAGCQSPCKCVWSVPPPQLSVMFPDTRQGLPSGKLSRELRASGEAGQDEEGLAVRGEGQVGRQELLGQGL